MPRVAIGAAFQDRNQFERGCRLWVKDTIAVEQPQAGKPSLERQYATQDPGAALELERPVQPGAWRPTIERKVQHSADQPYQDHGMQQRTVPAAESSVERKCRN